MGRDRKEHQDQSKTQIQGLISGLCLDPMVLSDMLMEWVLLRDAPAFDLCRCVDVIATRYPKVQDTHPALVFFAIMGLEYMGQLGTASVKEGH